MIRSITAVVFFALIIAVGAAEADSPSIGLILPLTGPTAPFGAVVQRGVNNAGPDAKKLIIEDDQCLPLKGLNAFRSLQQQSVRYFLGPCCTTSMITVAPLIKQEKLLAMNVCTGAERAWELSGGRAFHSQMSADEESRQNAKMMWSRGIKKVVILYVEQEYALAHERAFKAAFPGEVVESLSFTGTDIAQVKQLALKLKTLQFDALYIPIVEPFFLGILTEAAKVGAKPKNVFSVFSFQLPEVMAAEGKNAEGVIYSYPDIPSQMSAAEYFAEVGTRFFLKAAESCGQDLECARKQILESGEFDEHGFFKGKIVWKTVKDGKFEELKDG